MDTSAQQQPDSTAQAQPEAPTPTPGGSEAAQAQPSVAPPPSGEVRMEAPEGEEGPGAIGRLGEVLKKPSVGATVTGGLVLGVASMFGVLEAAVAAGAAYAAYRLLRRKQP